MKNIFISYSHQDHICASGIARYLQRHGMNVWIDSEQLILGNNWSLDIDKALVESDATVCILSANSVRRTEVLREVDFSLKKMQQVGDNNFQVVFVILGEIHVTWFDRYGKSESTNNIIEHIKKYQHIQLNARGDITISAMKKLMTVLGKNGMQVGDIEIEYDHDDNEYVYLNGQPEKLYDNIGKNVYLNINGKICYYL